MCSAQPEVAAVLDWYSPEADPAYRQRGREELPLPGHRYILSPFNPISLLHAFAIHMH